MALVYNSDLPIPGFISASTGTHALVGSPKHPDAATALQLDDDYDEIDDPVGQYMKTVECIAMLITKMHNVLVSKDYWASA